MITLINLEINISLRLDCLTEDEYQKISNFFAVTDSNTPLENKKVIEILALDKRPFFASAKSINPSDEGFIRSAKIDLIC
jgi:hypothetical protein